MKYLVSCGIIYKLPPKIARRKWWLLLYLKSSEREREMWPAVDGDELQAVGSSSLLPTWFNQHLLPTCIAHNYSQLLSLTKIPIPISVSGRVLTTFWSSSHGVEHRPPCALPSALLLLYSRSIIPLPWLLSWTNLPLMTLNGLLNYQAQTVSFGLTL